MIEIFWDHTAVVVMHAWDTGTREQYPGWHRAVEYIPRAERICRRGQLLQGIPRCLRALELTGPPPPPPEQAEPDEVLLRLRRFREENVFPGKHNMEDVKRGFQRIDFASQARSQGDEGIAEDGHQLFALCRHYKVNHLIYARFAINWCLLLSPGRMAEISRHGIMCSAFR